ncbi:MAG: type II toxin-antitoxin system HipA family toxin YjjJ [Xenophilus sp.]
MPPPALASVEQLRRLLAMRPVAAATELARALGVSVPTVHRLLARLPAGEWVTAGKARRARYALSRPLRGGSAVFPAYRVDRNGRLENAGSLALLHLTGSWMPLAPLGWPVPEDARDGWWPGLPYPLYQMRPQGYMGRQFARAEHLRLALPQEVSAWSDDDVLFAMCQAGSDLSGDLIVGEPACELWLRERAQQAEPVSAGATVQHYAQQAQRAVAAGVPGSSAAGEFPKFTARRALDGASTPHVIVKFSGADASASVQRWSDLLVCEHLALQHITALPGIQAARSRILHGGGRVFLEVERFDRHGDAGRSPLCALDVVDAALAGSGSTDWTKVVAGLLELDVVDGALLSAVTRLWWYGRLIANTDMHLGNLALEPDGRGRFSLAPAYDMLPMRYAPLAGGEVPTPGPEFALPLPDQRTAWFEACAAALAFWGGAATDARVSSGFRAVCLAQRDALERLRERA